MQAGQENRQELFVIHAIHVKKTYLRDIDQASGVRATPYSSSLRQRLACISQSTLTSCICGSEETGDKTFRISILRDFTVDEMIVPSSYERPGNSRFPEGCGIYRDGGGLTPGVAEVYQAYVGYGRGVQ